jgi:hypothetical protein
LIIVLIISVHGPDAEKNDNEDDEYEHYQADHDEKHSTTQQAMAARLAPARHTRPSTRAFPCIASTLDTSKAGRLNRESGAPLSALS